MYKAFWIPSQPSLFVRQITQHLFLNGLLSFIEPNIPTLRTEVIHQYTKVLMFHSSS